jgi:predicted RNase H-like nuclease (RuvC/YqgF family)
MEFEERKGIRVESSHERDSLAAALKAYQRVKNLIAKARARIEEAGLGKDADLILSRVLKGTPISAALEEFSSKEVGRESKYFELRKELARADNYVKRLILKIRELKEEIERYKEMIRKKDEEISDLRRRIEYLEEMRNLEIEIDRRISARDSRIRELEKELERERWQIELLRSQLKALSDRSEIPGIKIKVLSSLAKEKIDSMNENAEVILVLDASGASSSVVKKLKSIGVKILLYRGRPPPPDFLMRASEEGIFVDSEENYRIAWNGITPVIPMDEALKLLARSGENKELKRGTEFDIVSLIEDYRQLLMKRDEKRETSELFQ